MKPAWLTILEEIIEEAQKEESPIAVGQREHLKADSAHELIAPAHT